MINVSSVEIVKQGPLDTGLRATHHDMFDRVLCGSERLSCLKRWSSSHWFEIVSMTLATDHSGMQRTFHCPWQSRYRDPEAGHVSKNIMGNPSQRVS
jgi:hypothetical protein